MPIRISPKGKGRSFRNTRRENRLEELGRVDAEKAHTSRGKRNLREEKDRIRSELKTGGRAATRPMSPEQKRKPRGAGPSAPSPRKKYFKSKTHGGGPDSGNIGKMKDMLSKFKDKGLGKKAGPSPEDLKRIKEKMPKLKKKYTPLKKGGSAVSKGGGITHKPQKKFLGILGDSKKSQKESYDKQRRAAREMSMSGRGKQFRDKTFTDRKTGRTVPDTKRNRERYKDRVYKSKASDGRAKYAAGGVSKILGKLGRAIKKQPLPKKTKDLNKKFKKAFPDHDSKGKLKTTRPGYSSGGVVMAGKKVGCQIK